MLAHTGIFSSPLSLMAQGVGVTIGADINREVVGSWPGLSRCWCFHFLRLRGRIPDRLLQILL